MWTLWSADVNKKKRTIVSTTDIFRTLLALLIIHASIASALLGPPKDLQKTTYNNNNNNNNDDDSNKVLSRHRRFLFPASTGWVITATFILSIPVDSDITGTMVFTFPFRYVLDTGVVTGGRRMGRLPRSASDKHAMPTLPPSPSPILRREEQRLTLIAGLEDWLHELQGVDKLGAMGEALDVHSCALRVVCEVAMVPHSEGLIGELLHLLLTPRDLLPKLPPAYRASDYIQAQVDGGLHGDCANYERRCPISFFQILDGYSVDQLQEEFFKMYLNNMNNNNYTDLDSDSDSEADDDANDSSENTVRRRKRRRTKRDS